MNEHVLRDRHIPRPERILSGIVVVAAHVALGYFLFTAARPTPAAPDTQSLQTFTVAPDPPPPELPRPAPAPSKAAQGAAAPPALRARPKEIVAPRPILPPPPAPIRAAPIAADGEQARAGAAETPGPGTGAGGVGEGLGSGGQGSGTGGGIAAPSQRLRGEIRDRDYPGAARRARAQGVVTASYTVATNGRAQDCRIERSSGNAELDATTCRLIEQRFRFRPARDAAGRPVAERRGWQQRWWLEGQE